MVVKGNELRKPLAAHGSISMMRFVNHIHYHKTHPILRISHAERIGSHNEAMDHGTMKLIEIGKTKKQMYWRQTQIGVRQFTWEC